MALQAGRVGVNKNQVDWQGNIIGGGGGPDLTPRVSHLESQVGTFEFLVQEGVAGYKKAGADTFHPFRRLEEKEVNYSSSNQEVQFPVGVNPNYIVIYIKETTSLTGSPTQIILLRKISNDWIFLGVQGTGTSVGGYISNAYASVDDVNRKLTFKCYSSQAFSNKKIGVLFIE